MVVIWNQRDVQPMERFLFDPAEDYWQRATNESIRRMYDPMIESARQAEEVAFGVCSEAMRQYRR